ncbi:hypothetical protein [uncultured Stenotrophomonas sp.]|uniref:hypothetical protein n=1 Tax=uncultured Stenotrophomonas sp. TaxID=165438 RepID=UPI0028D876CF|nr:hypothetical protein [uncultured Stenotrophomonas sp.]
MNFVNNDISLIAVMSMAALLPFLIAAGTCYLKFSVVFVLLRNGLGLQQVPSNMVLNALALMLAFYVMQPIVQTMPYGAKLLAVIACLLVLMAWMSARMLDFARLALHTALTG